MKLKHLFAAAAIALAACGEGTTTPLFRDLGPPPPLPAGATVVTLSSGLQYAEIAVGAGALAQAGSRVQVHYTGWLASTNEAFDSSRQRSPVTFTVGAGSFIPGFEQGIVGMRVGGQRRLIIPPSLAYGNQEVRSEGSGRLIIPANSTLIFDVELVAINP